MTVLTTFTSVTEKMEGKIFEQVPCIRYLVTFKDQTEALLNSGNKVNAMSLVFAYQLGLKIRKTNFGAQKIDGTTLEIYKIVVSTFSV